MSACAAETAYAATRERISPLDCGRKGSSAWVLRLTSGFHSTVSFAQTVARSSGRSVIVGWLSRRLQSRPVPEARVVQATWHFAAASPGLPLRAFDG